MNNESRRDLNGHKAQWQFVAWLIAIAVIAVVLYPVFATARTNSHPRACISNLKQVSLATIFYASDNDDAFPLDFTFDGNASAMKFMTVVIPYLKNERLFLCPIIQREILEKKPHVVGEEGISGKMDYVHCLALRGFIPNYDKGKRVLDSSQLAQPAEVSYLRDQIRGYGTADDNKETGFLSPHGGGFNISYLDGHAKYEKSPNINTIL